MIASGIPHARGGGRRCGRRRAAHARPPREEVDVWQVYGGDHHASGQTSTTGGWELLRYRPGADERLIDNGETDDQEAGSVHADGGGSLRLGPVSAECHDRAIGTAALQPLSGRVGALLRWR